MAPPKRPLTGPDDPRHGTVAGFRQGCTEPCCREAERARNRRHKAQERARLGIPAPSVLTADQLEDLDFMLRHGEQHLEPLARRLDVSEALLREHFDLVGWPAERYVYPFMGVVRHAA